MTHTTTTQTCTICPAVASGLTCDRCMAPLCLEHSPFAGKWCEACELGYMWRRDSVGLRSWFWAGFALIWPIFFGLAPAIMDAQPGGGVRGFSTQIPILDAAIMATLIGWFLGKCAVAIRTGIVRRSFLREARVGGEGRLARAVALR